MLGTSDSSRTPKVPVPTALGEMAAPRDFAPTPSQEAAALERVRRARFGMLAAFSAALLYTVTNALMRMVALEVDPWLPNAIRATVTFLVFLPVFLRAGWRGEPLFPGPRGTLHVTGVALLSQTAGNVALQYSMAVLGVALVIPVCTGAMVIGGVILGWLILGEKMERRMWFALPILIASLFLFQGGSGEARESMLSGIGGVALRLSAVTAIVAAIISGAAFAALSVSIRSVKGEPAHVLAPIMLVSIVGIAVLWPAFLVRSGVVGLASVDARQYATMISAGLANAAAFFCLISALRRLAVNWVNAINVSQVGLAALVGVLCFGEPASRNLTLGLAVMLAGFGALYLKTLKTPTGA